MVNSVNLAGKILQIIDTILKTTFKFPKEMSFPLVIKVHRLYSTPETGVNH